MAKARLWADKQPDLGADPQVVEAYATGAAWLASGDPDHLTTNPMPPILGSLDNNSANYLWDTAEGRVHIVDWEDSGQSDRASRSPNSSSTYPTSMISPTGNACLITFTSPTRRSSKYGTSGAS